MASRTFPGHYSLMPAFGYGQWLSVDGMNGGRPLDMDGLRAYLGRIGVEPSMYTRAAATTAASSTTTPITVSPST